jgi:protein TonB
MHDHPEFGVTQGPSSIEVDLVASPLEEALPQEAVPPVPTIPAEEEYSFEPDPGPFPVESIPQEVTKIMQSLPIETSKNVRFVRNPDQGKDRTSFSSIAGAQAQMQPSYLRNPAPPYPDAAQRLGQEGLVLLKVGLSDVGRVQGVDLLRSSGYPILDEAALKAVRKWKFRPAKLGSVPVEAQVEVPIRFRIQ